MDEESTKVSISIIPKDEKPAEFSSEKEMLKTVPLEIKKCKKNLSENSHNSERANYYREQLWRFENAIVVDNPNKK
jgi:hypothetical protein